MQDEITLLDCSDFLVQFQEVRRRSHQLCEESRRLCTESQQQRLRNPWPHPISSGEPLESVTPYAEQPAEDHADDTPESQQNHPVDAAAHAEALQLRAKEPTLTEQQILDLMAVVLDHLPLEQQLHIIKTLCARIMAVTRARLDIKLVRSA